MLSKLKTIIITFKPLIIIHLSLHPICFYSKLIINLKLIFPKPFFKKIVHLAHASMLA